MKKTMSLANSRRLAETANARRKGEPLALALLPCLNLTRRGASQSCPALQERPSINTILQMPRRRRLREQAPVVWRQLLRPKSSCSDHRIDDTGGAGN